VRSSARRKPATAKSSSAFSRNASVRHTASVPTHSFASCFDDGEGFFCRLDAHDLATKKTEPDLALLPPLVAEALRDLVETFNVFIVGDPKGRELDARRPGPAELNAIKRVLAAAAPIVEAVRHEKIATPLR
jgi:hypothetical protein